MCKLTMATKYKIFNGLTLSVCKCPPNPTAKPLWATRSRQCNLKHLCMKQAKEKYRQSRLAILRKIKREAKPTHKPTQFASHFILPNAPKPTHHPTDINWTKCMNIVGAKTKTYGFNNYL